MSMSARIHGLMMPGRLALFREMVRFLLSKGVWIGNTSLQDGLNSEKYKRLQSGQQISSGLMDALTPIGFTVPFTSTVSVSGGGAALQTAVTAAAAGTKLVITDSLTYSPVIVSGCIDLTIEAAAGQTPVIKNPAPPVAMNFGCIRLKGVVDGFAIRGVTLSGNGNRNTLSFLDDGLINARTTVEILISADRIIIEDCLFSEDGTSNALSAPGIGLYGTDGIAYKRVSIHRCTFLNNANGAAVTGIGYGACNVTGFGTVFIQNCKIQRTDAIVLRASSSMRGYCWKNLSTTVEDCLVFDIGTAGSNEAYNHLGSVSFGTAVGPSTVRNCVVFRGKRGYRMQQAGATMTVTTSVYDTDLAGILAGQVAVRQTAGTMVFRNNVMVGAADGTAFEAAVTEDHNDVFNFGATGKVLDATDLTLNPAFTNPALNDYRATQAAVIVGASDAGPMGVRYSVGEVIFWAGV